MTIMDVIMTTVITGGLSILCITMGIIDFNRIYPVRYGKNRVELNGIVVGEQDMKIEGRGGIRIVQIPVVQFTWEGKSYEIADRTNYLVKLCRIGDEVIVCYNPTKNKNAAIIKRRGLFWTYFFWFIMAIALFVCMILEILVFIKVIG
ncbi:MAG: hypothetical protein K2J90_04775 [Lachnospiraceae bacterium]|nr:hypothetical protein [Lachnospiraceae bacterium]